MRKDTNGIDNQVANRMEFGKHTQTPCMLPTLTQSCRFCPVNQPWSHLLSQPERRRWLYDQTGQRDVSTHNLLKVRQTSANTKDNVSIMFLTRGEDVHGEDGHPLLSPSDFYITPSFLLSRNSCNPTFAVLDGRISTKRHQQTHHLEMSLSENSGDSHQIQNLCIPLPPKF